MSIILMLKILKQTWIYEHFPIMRPPRMEYTKDLLRACMWGSCGSTEKSLDKLEAVREVFDYLRADKTN